MPAPWGWVIVDKTMGHTSTRTTSRVRRLFSSDAQKIKAGHCGTLDPLASGILPIALGPATALMSYLLQYPKTYEFTLRWGEATTTDDSAGDILHTSQLIPTLEQIRSILPQFCGAILQRPPRYSAIRIQGQRAYHRAQRDEAFDIPLRKVQVHDLILLDHHHNETCLRMTCGSGTYVRSMATDLATALQTYAHIISLRRTCVGPFSSGLSLDFLEQIRYEERIERVVPAQTVLGHLARYDVNSIEKRRLWDGLSIQMKTECIEATHKASGLTSDIVRCHEGDQLIALTRISDGFLQPMRCFIGEL